jgi:IMP dehydrogenase
MSDYDNVYLVPKQISTIRSRKDVDLRSDFHGLYPIMSSPMKNISGSELVIEMGKNNCLGILHRFDVLHQRLTNIEKVSQSGVRFGVAIGVNDFERELQVAKFSLNLGAVLVVLDLANGYLPQIAECGKLLREKLGNNISLATGNVVNKVGAQYIKDSGFNFVRVSIGSGSVCLTRNVTGVGRNTLAALNDCSSVDVNLIVDGGIKSSGDAVKAFAVGADFIFLGSLLAYANEAEGKDGKMFGMASLTNHQLNHKEIKSIEGKDTQIDMTKRRPLKEILDEFMWGIKSGCTYLNSKSYKDISTNCDIAPVNEGIYRW